MLHKLGLEASYGYLDQQSDNMFYFDLCILTLTALLNQKIKFIVVIY